MTQQGDTPEEEGMGNWKQELKDAVDDAFAGHPVGTQAELQIFAKKTRNNPLHDYRVVLKNPH